MRPNASSRVRPAIPWSKGPSAWAALVGIVSLGLILLALTGIYLWFRLFEERAVGIALLVVSLVCSLTLAIWLRST